METRPIHHEISLGYWLTNLLNHTSPTFVLSLAGYKVSKYPVSLWPRLLGSSLRSPACVYIPRPFPALEESLNNYTLRFH